MGSFKKLVHIFLFAFAVLLPVGAFANSDVKPTKPTESTLLAHRWGGSGFSFYVSPGYGYGYRYSPYYYSYYPYYNSYYYNSYYPYYYYSW